MDFFGGKKNQRPTHWDHRRVNHARVPHPCIIFPSPLHSLSGGRSEGECFTAVHIRNPFHNLTTVIVLYTECHRRKQILPFPIPPTEPVWFIRSRSWSSRFVRASACLNLAVGFDFQSRQYPFFFFFICFVFLVAREAENENRPWKFSQRKARAEENWRTEIFLVSLFFWIWAEKSFPAPPLVGWARYGGG